MKLQEITSQDGDPVLDIIAAIDAAMNVRGAMLADLQVEEDTVDFVVVYDFPEHEVSVGEVSAALKRKGRVRSDNEIGDGDGGETPVNFTFKMSNEFDDYNAVEDAITKHFKDRMRDQ